MTLESTFANTRNWARHPAALTLDGEVLTVEAGAESDIFANPLNGEVRDDAARALLDAPPGDWQFSARVRVDFRAPWDAGALMVWAAPDQWAKLNFERSPDGRPTLYSVVTQGLSDDAVGWPVDHSAAWLRISRVDGAFAFHASIDGRSWRLARQFGLQGVSDVRIGIEVQSPVGEGCGVSFDHMALVPSRLADLFDGS
ncbi:MULTISPECIES: DUF1349 domain-containing protein [Streptomyces]|uniref:DUF1349 domain-containing protein n=1 Tax=Streptomyces viridochromogenes TaxID=1938 RepID=A0A0L8L8P5_STRVR|nr:MULTISPECIES: DUF1349 domain-containing protein [Streptomyces]KOG34446.1 hypothetical protein ADK34_06850 [Streptomyces viridochromogenes]